MTVATLVTPGETTYWVNNLTNADHTVRLVKRTECPWTAGGFGAASGGAILAKPAARSRQTGLIGDPFTRNSDADVSFGALTAHSMNADYQINAQTGMGMVPNHADGNPGTDFRAYDAAGSQHRNLAERGHLAPTTRCRRPGHQRLLHRPERQRAVEAYPTPSSPPCR